MKRLVLVIFSCLVMISVIGCSSSKDKFINNEEIAKDLLSSISFKEELSKVDDDTAYRLYDIDKDDIESECTYIGSGATAEEVSVWMVKDDSSINKIKEKVHKRVEEQKKGYKDYKPEEVPKLENAVITTKYNYIVLCISEDNSKAKEIINSFF